MVDTDFSDFDKLFADLGEVPENSGENINKAVNITSLRVKKAWQEPLKGSRTFPALPYAITYDVGVEQVDGQSVIKSEIGFDKGRNQGPLGNISEFGTPTITGRGYGIKALQDNEADFHDGLELAVDQALKKAGL